ncbi:MAG: hypothetical protein JRE58_12745 [Deltaproteobacteria bacterium]|nr:hypothetical protein [Deltaproteobacteria bacterium]
MHHIWIFILAIVLLNLPFGFWRKGEKKFSLTWFLAVHIPVPLAVGIRFLAGYGWNPSSLPLFIAAFFTGQYVGGKFRSFLKQKPHHRH